MTTGVNEGSLPTQEVAPEQAGWIANKFGQIRFALDGIREHLKRITGMMSERGPDPDYSKDEEDLREFVRRGFHARPPEIRIDRYTEGGNGPTWQTWILTIVGSLIVLGIAGVVYQLTDIKSDMRAFLKGQADDERRLDNLEKKVYRGAE